LKRITSVFGSRNEHLKIRIKKLTRSLQLFLFNFEVYEWRHESQFWGPVDEEFVE